MDKLYEVTFTYKAQKYRTEVEADSKYDAIDRASLFFTEIGMNGEWEARLIAIDGEPVNRLEGDE